MIRFKYHPDNWVAINDSYMESFDSFALDCAALGMEVPFYEGQYMEYIPPLGSLQERGLAVLDDVGRHSAWDGVAYPEYQAFTDRADDFIAARDARNQPIPGEPL